LIKQNQITGKKGKDHVTQRIPLTTSETQHQDEVFQQYGERNVMERDDVYTTISLIVLSLSVHEGPRTEREISLMCT